MIDSHVSLSVRVVRETRLPANTVFKAAKHPARPLAQTMAALGAHARVARILLRAPAIGH